VWKAAIEIAFIVFLFYSNLLMGEFTRSRGQGRGLVYAIEDMVTAENFAIALVAAVIGYLGFEALRRKNERD
jgi:hypothetical protein